MRVRTGVSFCTLLVAFSLVSVGRYEAAAAAQSQKTRSNIERTVLERGKRLHAMIARRQLPVQRPGVICPGPDSEQESAQERSKRIHTYLAAQVHLRYSLLYRQLRLDPGKQAAFESVATEGEERLRDIYDSTIAQGLTWDSPILQGLESQARKETLAEEGALLSPAQAQTLDYFDRTTYARQIEATITGQLYGTETLSDAQANAITSTLVSLTPGFEHGSSLGSSFDETRAESQLASVLSPAQLTIFKSTVDSDQKMRLLNQLEEQAKRP